jgi:cobalt transporter subunit CbtA
MFKSLVFSAFGAGLAVCLAVSALQFLTTAPLILHAEAFERPGAAAMHSRDHGDAGADEASPDAAWSPGDDIERATLTVLANLVAGLAASLVLVGLMVLRGGSIDAGRGLLWGIGGFAAASFLPSLGLPPELPGTPSSDIVDRQLWWLATVAASAIGLAILAFSGHWAVKVLGLAFVVAPHVIGAPPPPSLDVPYPGALAGEFVVASLAVGAVFWCVAGTAGGWLYRRLAQA